MMRSMPAFSVWSEAGHVPHAPTNVTVTTPVDSSTLRSTAPALLELIGNARESVYLVTFAAYRVPEVADDDRGDDGKHGREQNRHLPTGLRAEGTHAQGQRGAESEHADEKAQRLPGAAWRPGDRHLHPDGIDARE